MPGTQTEANTTRCPCSSALRAGRVLGQARDSAQCICMAYDSPVCHGSDDAFSAGWQCRYQCPVSSTDGPLPENNLDCLHSQRCTRFRTDPCPASCPASAVVKAVSEAQKLCDERLARARAERELEEHLLLSQLEELSQTTAMPDLRKSVSDARAAVADYDNLFHQQVLEGPRAGHEVEDPLQYYRRWVDECYLASCDAYEADLRRSDQECEQKCGKDKELLERKKAELREHWERDRRQAMNATRRSEARDCCLQQQLDQQQQQLGQHSEQLQQHYSDLKCLAERFATAEAKLSHANAQATDWKEAQATDWKELGRVAQITSRAMDALASCRPFLGVSFAISPGRGVLLKHVRKGSFGWSSRLLGGDVLLQIDGTRVYDIESAKGALSSLLPGDTVAFRVFRANQGPTNVRVVMGAKGKTMDQVMCLRKLAAFHWLRAQGFSEYEGDMLRDACVAGVLS